MATLKPRHVRGAAVLAAVLMIFGSCRAKDESEKKNVESSAAVRQSVSAEPSLELGLSISPGGPEVDSLLSLRLYSPSLRQTELDNVTRKDPEKVVAEPLRISIPRESWATAAFWIVEEKAAATEGLRRKLQNVVLVLAPESENAALGGRDTLAAVYRLPAANLPPSETILQAEIRIGEKTIFSAPIPVPASPSSGKTVLLRKAEIQLKLEFFPEAGLTAEGLISRFPEEAAGYWIKGRALEGQGRDAEALKTYRTALEKALAGKDAANNEPPMPIILKIGALEDKLSSPEKK